MAKPSPSNRSPDHSRHCGTVKPRIASVPETQRVNGVRVTGVSNETLVFLSGFLI